MAGKKGKKGKKGRKRKSEQAAVGDAGNSKRIKEVVATKEESEDSQGVEAAEADQVMDKGKGVAAEVVSEVEEKRVWWGKGTSLISDLEDAIWKDPPPMVKIPDGAPLIKIHKYEVLRTLGFGHLGRVRAVQHKTSGKLYAMKIIHVPGQEDVFSKKVSDQMALALTLNHPHIVRCHAVQTKPDLAYFLYDLMTHSLKGYQTQDEKTLARIAHDVLKGLDYLKRERNLVLKYLCPSNILYDENEGIYKIGEAGNLRDAFLFRKLHFYIESYRYTAPELLSRKVLSEVKVGGIQKCDAWSLGLCLLEVYLGRFPIDYDRRMAQKGVALPFFEEDPPQAPPQAPPESSQLFRNFISRCLQRSPDKRANVSELLSDPFVTYSHQSKL